MSKAINIVTSIPGPRSQALIKRRTACVPRAISMTHPLFVERAHGATVTDVDGNTFLDFTGGIGVMNIGHTQTDVVEAVKAQVEKLTHICFQVAGYESYVQVAEMLCRLTPGQFEKRAMLVNSGAEAVENAVKVARAHTKRSGILCFEHAFHGRTLLGLTLTGKSSPYKAGFGPYAGEVYRLPFPYLYRGYGEHLVPGPKATPDGSLLARALKTLVRPEDMAAIIIEPVLGEGGFVAAPKAFLQEIRAFCDKYGVVFIADEVQSGFCRTGAMFACERLGVVPDITAVAKSIAGGLPLAGFIARASMVDELGPGSLGGTFAGNPVACAAGVAAMQFMERGGLAQRAEALGEHMEKRFLELKAELPLIGDVRGLGAMRAIELVRDPLTKEPADKATGAVIAAARARGVLLLSAGTYASTLRFLMPLSITDQELDEGLDVVETCLREAKI